MARWVSQAGRALGQVGRRHWLGLAVVAAATAAMMAYRAAYIEPRAWGTLCAAAAPPLACAPRAALVWLQTEYLWGSMALLLGLWAFLARGPLLVCVAAVVAGMARWKITTQRGACWARRWGHGRGCGWPR